MTILITSKFQINKFVVLRGSGRVTERNIIVNINMVRRKFVRFYEKIKSLKLNKYIRGKSLSCIRHVLCEEF